MATKNRTWDDNFRIAWGYTIKLIMAFRIPLSIAIVGAVYYFIGAPGFEAIRDLGLATIQAMAGGS